MTACRTRPKHAFLTLGEAIHEGEGASDPRLDTLRIGSAPTVNATRITPDRKPS
jgi:hypothetical protein